MHWSFLELNILLFIKYALYSQDTLQQKSYKGYKVFVIPRNINSTIASDVLEFMNTNEFATHSQNGLLFIEPTHKTVDMLIAPQLAPDLEKLFPRANFTQYLTHHDFSELMALEKPSTRSEGFSWSSYYDLHDINMFLRSMHHKYPNTAELIVGGNSYEQRHILGLKIDSKYPRYYQRQKKPIVVIEAGIHGREWISIAAVTYFIHQLLTSSDPAILALMDSFEWHIFPVVNPDGYHYSFTVDRLWRKSRSKTKIPGCFGVDLNRNWGHAWLENEYPCSENYMGPKAFSEPESYTFAKYLRQLKNITAYISFHSYAKLLLAPYSDQQGVAKDFRTLELIGRKSLDFGEKSGYDRYAGPGVAKDLLYPANGVSMDWVRETLNVPITFTYELRGDSFHWPPSLIYQQGEEVTQLILGMFVGANNVGYVNVPSFKRLGLI